LLILNLQLFNPRFGSQSTVAPRFSAAFDFFAAFPDAAIGLATTNSPLLPGISGFLDSTEILTFLSIHDPRPIDIKKSHPMDFVESLVRIGNRVKKSFIAGTCLGNKSRRKELLRLSLTFYSLGRGPREGGVAGPRRGDRRRVGGELQMAEHLADDLGLGDGGDDAERPAPTRRATLHVEGKHPFQQARPAPVRRGAAGRRRFGTLLARRRGDEAAEPTVRRQTPTIAHQVHPRQRHQRRQLLQKFSVIRRLVIITVYEL
jgi:hypothetical protein